ncbi:MAG TPA: RNA 2',3'-cyclic phosphodiesterase [Candidatus Saccharimonadales bacterium]|nr:RNA 2',3'-cyclic phosphodiesterase [Candidatus Saccharimonadales bacterium]
MRCFLAVPIAEPGLAAAQRLQAELRERVEDVRWARPETLHLTVHFFGQIDEDRAATALDLVAPIAARTTPFDIALDQLGAFPGRGTPRVLWLGPAHDVAPLNALALECQAVLGGAGFDVEDRPYHAHCTLGRPRLPWSAGARAAWGAATAQHQVEARFTASRLVLYESRPAPGGAFYTERSLLSFASA